MSRDLAEDFQDCIVTCGLRLVGQREYPALQIILPVSGVTPVWPDRLMLGRVPMRNSAGVTEDLLLLFDPSAPSNPLAATAWNDGYQQVIDLIERDRTLIVEVCWPYWMQRALVSFTEVVELTDPFAITKQTYLQLRSEDLDIVPTITARGGEA